MKLLVRIIPVIDDIARRCALFHLRKPILFRIEVLRVWSTYIQHREPRLLKNIPVATSLVPTLQQQLTQPEEYRALLSRRSSILTIIRDGKRAS